MKKISRLAHFQHTLDGYDCLLGDLIGYVGATQLPRPPMVSKPHLHFEWLVEAPRTASGRIIVYSKSPRRFEPTARLRRYNRALA